MFGCGGVAQALVPAASALMPTPSFDTVARPRESVETSLVLVSTRQARVPAPHRVGGV
ncbi:hypothetical protein SBA4_4350006 [Candidatus Sulfopaludibacter sp. SbA4]|nr:hypothetical protein SBA4_4350006 [Candidatus Sulfopaludibacter sp. SbA4]